MIFGDRVVAKDPHPKAKGYLYPDEEARLIANTSIDLCFRVFYGFLAREGMRSDEAKRLEWSNVDLERGAVRLDENKTDDPRAWALSPDVARALRIWRQLCPSKRHVFVNGRSKSMTKNNGAEQFRTHLQRAGIDRPELFEESATRLQIRLHDLRATFITIKLANGRTETWIADRTGHKSSDQINNYRRAARTVAELGLGDFAPMDETIPELRDHGKPTPPGGAAPADEGGGEAEAGSESSGGGVKGAGDGGGAEPSEDAGAPAGGAADESGSAPTPAGPPPALPEEEGGSAVAATAPRIPRASGPRWATAERGSADRDADPAWNTAVFAGRHRQPGKISRCDLGGGGKTLRVWRPEPRRSGFWGPPMSPPAPWHPAPPALCKGTRPAPGRPGEGWG